MSLETSFRRLIRQTGPMSLARYMGEANAHYYTRGEAFGRQGDFVTAPDVSQMFGEMVGLWCADLWQRAGRPDRIAYVELGPGRGTLAKDALRVMARQGMTPQIHLVEGSATLATQQREAVPGAKVHGDLDGVPRDTPILLVANEFLDALPVRQLVLTPKGWRERMIGLDAKERFVFVAGDQPMDDAVPEDRRDQPVDSILETCPGAAAIVEEVALRLQSQGGAALFIDYGTLAPQTGSTFQAVRRHEKVDPLRDPGSADLTAHVDFASLEATARTAGSDRVYATTQGAFLERLGITARAQALVAAQPDRRSQIAGEHRRLCAPDAMGELFKAMALVAPDWPEPNGFA